MQVYLFKKKYECIIVRICALVFFPFLDFSVVWDLEKKETPRNYIFVIINRSYIKDNLFCSIIIGLKQRASNCDLNLAIKEIVKIYFCDERKGA